MWRCRRRWWCWWTAILTVLVVSGCAGESQGGQGEALSGELTVFAAASLTDSFTELKKEFETQHPDLDVRMSFAGSSSLSRQIVRGAPAGVFASANPQQMRKAVNAGKTAGEPRTFVRNELRIAVPDGNPAKVRGLAAFGKDTLKIAVCAEQVPCGAAARKSLRLASVQPKADTLEQDVKAVLTKVRLGEVDAGLVYKTDVAAAHGAVEGIDFPQAATTANDYRIAALSAAPNSRAARAFADFVRSEPAKRILAEYGFDTEIR